MCRTENLRLAVLASGSSACGIAGQWVLLTALGAGLETDAYFLALALPQVVLAIATGPLLNVLVPLLAVESEHARQRMVRQLAFSVGGAGLLLSAVLGVLAPIWVPLAAPGFSGIQATLAVSIAQIQMGALALSILVLVLSAGSQAGGSFVRVESATLIGSLVSLAAIVFATPMFGVLAAAWAGVARAFIQAALLLPRQVHTGDHGSSPLPKVWARAQPLLLSGALAKTDPLLDRVLLSLAPGGALSVFQLAQGLLAVGIEIIHRSMIAPAIPILSRASTHDLMAFRKKIRKLLTQVGLLTAVALIGFSAFGENLLRWILESGQMTKGDISTLWWITLGLAGVLIGGCVGQIGASAFYASGDTRTPARLAVISFACFVPLKIGAFFAFGVAGIVAMCSTYYLTNAAILLMLLRRSSGTAG